MGAHRLGEAVVDEQPAAAGLPVQHAVERLWHARAMLGLVEAESHEIMHGAARLRRAERIDILHVAGERIGGAAVVGLGIAQEGGDVADGGEADRGHHRVLGLVGELVKRGRAERIWPAEIARGELYGGKLGVHVVPVARRHRERLVFVVAPHREARLRLIGAHGRIGEPLLGRGRVLVDDEFFGIEAGDRGAIGVLGDRHGGGKRLAVARRGEIPAGVQDRVALAHQKAVAGVARGFGVVLGAAVVERAEHIGAAAIGDFVEEPLVGLGAVDRAQDLEVGRIGRGAVGVFHREVDVHDDAVDRVLRVDLADDPAADALILPDGAEGFAAHRPAIRSW